MKFKKTMKTLSVSFLVLIFAFLSTFVGFPQNAVAQSVADPVSKFWDFDGNVNSIVHSEDGETVYVGGTFSRVLSEKSGGMVFNDSTGWFDTITPTPIITGTVDVSIPDGNGGWYIAGDFTDVNGVERDNLAHILSNNSLDTNFRPDVNGRILSMVLNRASNTLYIGGEFTSVDGQNRNKLAAINTSNRQVTAWNPSVGATVGVTPRVDAMAINTSAGVMYIGGSFNSVGGQNRLSLASVNLSNGQPTSWNPSIRRHSGNYTQGGAINTAGRVRSIVIDNINSTIFVGGMFECVGGQDYCIGGQARSGLVAFDSSGVITNFNANISSLQGVNTLALKSGEHVLYLGGSFSNISGQTRNRLAAVNSFTGQLLPWNAAIPASVNNPGGGTYPSSVSTLVLDLPNDILYVGGQFSLIGGQQRHLVAAVDGQDASVTSWNANLDNFSGSNISVSSLVHDPDNDRIYVAGQNVRVAIPRSKIAAIDVSSGQPTLWNPGISTTVPGSLAVVKTMVVNPSTNTLYVGGEFNTFGGQTRRNIGAVNIETAQVTSWNPNGSFVYVNEPLAFAIDPENNRFYAGGRFGVDILNLATGLNAGTDLTTGGNVMGGYVRSLALDTSSNTLYIGGYFSELMGVNRNGLAAVTLANRQVTSWNPNVTGGNNVNALVLDSANQTLYAGGDFTIVGGLNRRKLAAINTGTGVATGWDPVVEWAVADSSGKILSLSLDSDSDTVYVGGLFSSIDGQARERLAAISTIDGQVTDWMPSIGIEPDQVAEVRSVVVSESGDQLYAGGSFGSYQLPPNDQTPMMKSNFLALELSSISCLADFNGDGDTNNSDLFDFLRAWFSGDLAADSDRNGVIEVSDIFTYLSNWFRGGSNC